MLNYDVTLAAKLSVLSELKAGCDSIKKHPHRPESELENIKLVTPFLLTYTYETSDYKHPIVLDTQSCVIM